MKLGLAGRMIWEHRWSYIGLSVSLVASSVLVGSSLLLFDAAQAGDIHLSGLTSNEVAKQLGLLANGRFVSAFIAALGAVIAAFLVSQTMGFVVEERRQELAFMRLVGAGPRQVTWLVLSESLVLGAINSLIGALLSPLLVSPYANLLASSQNWPPGFSVSLNVDAVIWCVIVMTLVTGIGALGPVRRIGRTPPIDAIRSVITSSARISSGRWILAAIGLGSVVAFSTPSADSVNYQVTTAGVGGGAVLLVCCISPLIVPIVARAIGGVFMPIAPGASLVARQHTVYAASRTSALATPIVVLLALASVFGMLAQTGRAESALGLNKITNTDAVVEVPRQDFIRQSFQRVKDIPEIGDISRIQRAEDWAWDDTNHAREDFLEITGIDPTTFSHFVPTDVVAGRIVDIGGLDVAAITGVAELGDTLHIESPGGSAITVRVVAVIEPTSFIYGSLLVDSRGLSLSMGETDDTWLAQRADGVSVHALVSALAHATPSAAAMTRTAWVDQHVASTVEAQQAAIFTIIGGAAVLALFFLAQSTLASVRERRRELELLVKVGARRRSVVAAIVVESAMTSATAGFLAVGVVAAVYLRMSTALQELEAEVTPVIPTEFLASVLAACIVTSTGFAVLGATLALRRTTLS